LDLHGCRLIRFGRYRIRRGNIIDFFLEPLERFADTFTDLRKLSRPENDENNDKDNDQFRDPHGTKHGVVPFPSSKKRRRPCLFENQIKSIGQREALSRKG
jgi:hypothetical protein